MVGKGNQERLYLQRGNGTAPKVVELLLRQLAEDSLLAPIKRPDTGCGYS